MKRVYGILIASFILVGLPLVSYFYLKEGYDYRKAIMDTAGDYGLFPALNLQAVKGELPDSLLGQMLVVALLPQTEGEQAASYGTTLDSLHRQFSHSPHLYFLTIVGPQIEPAAVEAWWQRSGLPQVVTPPEPEAGIKPIEKEGTASSMLVVQQADSTQMHQLPRQLAYDKAGYTPRADQPLLTLVDRHGTIIKHYPLDQEGQSIELVKYIAAFIPLPEEEEIRVKRHNEL